jgi:hypothetical protein
MIGERKVAMITEPRVPMKEATIPMASAFPALPCWVMGNPSKQVAMAEDDPGIPIRTADINVPDTPPIHMASRMIKEVSVDSPNVIGSSNAIPSVADNPGMAPKMIPKVTTPMIRIRLIGCRHKSRADKKYSIIPPPYPKIMPSGSLILKP